MQKWLILFLTVITTLTACHSPVYNQTVANNADVKLMAQAARAKSNRDALPPPPIVVKPGLYVDTTPINLEREPRWLKNRIVIRGDQLPFSYYSRTIANGGGSYILSKYQTGLDPAVNVTMSYSGTVKGALDLLAAKTGYVYVVHSNSIFWQAFITKTFDVAFMPGSSDYFMGNKGGGGATSGASSTGATASDFTVDDYSSNEFSSLKGSLSIWSDMETTIKQLLSPDGKVIVSQSTTTVTVRDKPSNISLISQYIRNLNHTLQKQVLVKVQVLEIELNNDYNFGIDWNVIVNAFHNSPFIINGNYGTPVSITPQSPQNTGVSGIQNALPGPGTVPVFGTFQNKAGVPGYTILFNALNQQGKTTIVSEPRTVCLNNQVSVIRIVQSVGYVASIQQTTLASSSTTTTVQNNTVTSQITPGIVTTGITLYILPKVYKDKIFLQVNADLSTNNGISQLGGSGGQIQLPDVTVKHFNQRSVIRSGSTLILSGLRQLTNQSGANQFLTSQALGGKASTMKNAETIILITPFILGNV